MILSKEVLGKYVIARTQPGSVQGSGKLIGYSLQPMVCIQQIDGTRFWWNASLCDLEPEKARPEIPVDDEFKDWQRLEYVVGSDNNVPKSGRLVVIIVKTTASEIPEWLFASYKGDGQFMIETQAKLQDNGTHKKLTSTCHASFVTHWQYVQIPRE